jgi:tryptophan synthase alpha subunit
MVFQGDSLQSLAEDVEQARRYVSVLDAAGLGLPFNRPVADGNGHSSTTD